MIIEQTVEKINAGQVDLTRLTKTVLVIDEAQDMSAAEYSLVKALMEKNDNLRIIAVGDDDQNIYEFRGSSSHHIVSLLNEPDAKKYELIDNYRSNANIVEFGNQFVKKISHRLKTIPIMPKKNENGIISICKLASENIATPVVNKALDINPSGSTCIVTRTNEEALNIVGLLNKNGIASRQIQTNNNFNLYNLVELRDFINDIDVDDNSYAITDEVWQKANYNLNKKYEGSDNLSGALKLIKDFEETNNKTKYKSDFKQFVRESKLEDFISNSDNSILVSTIHQTKGREFDNIFLALSRFKKMNDETKRGIYVAITRAKQNLHILCNGDYFDEINVENIENIWKTFDNTDYPSPERISLQLSHRDVNLGYFAFRKNEIDALISGQELSISDTGCFINDKPDKQVLKFSSKFCSQIDELKSRGYSPTKAIVRHVLFWLDKDRIDKEDKHDKQEKQNKESEIKIFLPEVVFLKVV
jgi:ATP-dependent DNA helicase RecQ